MDNDAYTQISDMLDIMEQAIKSGDWKVDGACDPDMIMRRAEDMLSRGIDFEEPTAKNEVV